MIKTLKINLLFIIIFLGTFSPINAQQSIFSGEILKSDDIDYTLFSGLYSQSIKQWDFSLNLRQQSTNIHYQSAGFPIDIFTEEKERREDFSTVSLQVKKPISNTLSLSTNIVHQEGFSSHHAIWLDEYYRQLWGGKNLKGDTYQKPDPKGTGGTFNLRWEYIRSNAFLDVSIGYNRVTIAPGYDFMIEGDRAGELVRGIDELDIFNVTLATENNITQKFRTRSSLSLSNTTERDPRFTYSLDGNYAITENLIIRNTLSYAHEGDRFESGLLKTSLIYAINNQWTVFTTYSYYRDNGEVEQANLATDAAPDQRGYRQLLGITWRSESERHRLSLTTGIYDHQYKELGLDQRFAPLYQNREWDYLKLNYEFNF